MKRILTYGTFDLLHYGHIQLLRRAKAMGDYLAAGLFDDGFNAIKKKICYFSYAQRKELLEAVRYVDLIIPESTWEQKADDVKKYQIDRFVMGDDQDPERSWRRVRSAGGGRFASRHSLGRT